MCGIFGVVFGDSPLTGKKGTKLIERLFLLSESRGKEAAGLAIASGESLTIYKTPTTAKRMLRSSQFRQIRRDLLGGTQRISFIGHSRLVTDGVRDVNANNQPVRASGVVGVHNGIVVNDEGLWSEHRELERHSELDSEVIFALLKKHLSGGETLSRATAATFEEIEGAASIAALFDDADSMLLATNNGSLYYRAITGSLFVFASESYILKELAKEFPELDDSKTVHIGPGMAAIIDTSKLTTASFTMQGANGVDRTARGRVRAISDRSDSGVASAYRRTDLKRVDPERLLERFPYESMKDRLQRCTRCVLPETMPFVDFDDDGVCSYCRNYPPIEVHGHQALEQIVAPYRRGGEPDCIVGVSGGRDSIYGLHYLKRELKMNPIAYTYDWGMVTDLARRNTSRICGKLGIEHILVSADIPRKREFIRKNVDAWLARPTLGTIPLFMAGDKAYFHYLNQTKAQVGVEVSFLCENLFERTDFKTGFAGVAPFHDPDHVYTQPLSSKTKILSYYAREFLANPKYFNASLLDSAKAFAFYYLIRRRYHNLYRYVTWDENIIEDTLFGEYDFELAEDTQSSWRIGDGTAAFYNYIYYAIAGMTENDTFRSNQIRNGAITRDEALERIDRDNRPRFQSIQWYLDTIHLDRSIEDVLEIIGRAPKLYA